MSKAKPNETWVIRNKTTGEYFVAPSGKSSWRARGHAKNAWASIASNFLRVDQEALDKYFVKAISYQPKYIYPMETRERFPYFDEQDTWELVNLLRGDTLEASIGKQFKQALDLLEQVYEQAEDTGYTLYKDIKKFLEDNK